MGSIISPSITTFCNGLVVILTKSEEAEGLILSSHGGTRTPRPSFYLYYPTKMGQDGGVSLTCFALRKTMSSLSEVVFDILSSAIRGIPTSLEGLSVGTRFTDSS